MVNLFRLRETKAMKLVYIILSILLGILLTPLSIVIILLNLTFIFAYAVLYYLILKIKGRRVKFTTILKHNMKW